jgi:hypothetical protein
MNIKLPLTFLFSLFVFIWPGVFAQFPPGAGHDGTTAMYADSSAFIEWATTCHVTRGYVNIADTTVTYNGMNRASFGSDTAALGKADNTVVSLGDGGSAVLTFESPIMNEPGPDFAVFENSLDGTFLELGFVEVSSDGINFFRFPAVSLTQDTVQISTFGTIDPTMIDNLAGKYMVMYGTPFDLDLLNGTPGLDVSRITQVKIIDVVGNINPPYATYDSQGHKINDPWPTPFNTCGFDLDAVGVIHSVQQSVSENKKNLVCLYPDPVLTVLTVNFSNLETPSFALYTLRGNNVFSMDRVKNNTSIDLSWLPSGFYIGIFSFPDGTVITRKIIKL